MLQPVPQNPLTPEELLACADGELDCVRQLRATESMARDPQVMSQVLHQQQLRLACARVLQKHDGPCPDALRQRIRDLCESCEAASPAPAPAAREAATPSADRRGGAVVATLGRWLGPIAAAAAVALVLWAILPPPTAPTNPGVYGLENGGYTDDGLITAGLAHKFGERHDLCGQDPSRLLDRPLYPADVAELDDALTRRIGDQFAPASLDLSDLGYRFEQAGNCPLPGDRAAHLIYRNAADEVLSLWVKAYDGRPTLDPGVAYTPPRQHSGRPMVVWREADTVFYLVGDQPEAVQKARPMIGLLRS